MSKSRYPDDYYCCICGKNRNEGMFWNGITRKSYCYLHWDLDGKEASQRTLDRWLS